MPTPVSAKARPLPLAASEEVNILEELKGLVVKATANQNFNLLDGLRQLVIKAAAAAATATSSSPAAPAAHRNGNQQQRQQPAAQQPAASRTGTSIDRTLPASGVSSSSSSFCASLVPPLAVADPVGLPPPSDVKVYSEHDAWLCEMLTDLDSARTAMLSTYLYDHPRIQIALIRRLKEGPTFFECTVLVDAAGHEANTCRQQRSKLDQLRDVGAKVYLCSGVTKTTKGTTWHAGILHVKALVLDSRVAYLGSANFTEASARNIEVVVRMAGPPVLDIRDLLLKCKKHGKRWCA